MKAALALSLLAGLVLGVGAAEEKPVGPAFQVHGRLSLAKGNPGFRIWIVGTKRMLGIAESPPERPLMPAKRRDIAMAGQLVFADFTVVPLTEEEPGVMRIVGVIRTEHVVITDGTLKLIRLVERLEQEPNPRSGPMLPAVTSRAAARLAPAGGMVHL